MPFLHDAPFRPRGNPFETLEVMGGATYYDELRKDDGNWVITHRKSALYGGSFSDRGDSGHTDGKSVERRAEEAAKNGDAPK